MGVLQKSRHEQFAQLVAGGEIAGKAYVSLYGEAKGSDQSASRLLRNAQISARVAELKGQISSHLFKSGLRDRENRLKALQIRWEMLNQVIKERGQALGKLSIHGYEMGKQELVEGKEPEEEMPAPGASTGLVCLDWRGKDAIRAVWKVDTGLLSEMRAIEEQAARELGEWNPDPNGGGLTVPIQLNVTFVSPANA